MNRLLNTFKVSLVVVLVGILLYPAFEPKLLRAVTDDITVSQTVTAGISISSPADITLTPLTVTQDSAVGSTTWTVTSNNSAGYTMTVKASASPALVSGGNSFADYTEGSAGVKETWAVSNAYEFGFSGLGSHTTGYGTDSQSNCAEATDVPSTTLLWEGFNGTTGIEIASSSSVTNQSGIATTLCVATEQHTVFAPSGTYSATITATATTL